MPLVSVPDQTAVLDCMPHRPPMRLITRLTEADSAAGDFVTEAVLDAASPFCTPENDLDCLALVEMMAQAFAAGSALASLEAAPAEPAPGFLVGLREVRFYGQARVGERLRIRARLETQVGPFAVCSGQVGRVDAEETETLLAEGQFRLFVPEEVAL